MKSHPVVTPLLQYETLQEHSNCRNSDFFLNVINIEVRFQETISVGGKYFEETLVSKSCVEKLFHQNRTGNIFLSWPSLPVSGSIQYKDLRFGFQKKVKH